MIPTWAWMGLIVTLEIWGIVLIIYLIKLIVIDAGKV